MLPFWKFLPKEKLLRHVWPLTLPLQVNVPIPRPCMQTRFNNKAEKSLFSLQHASVCPSNPVRTEHKWYRLEESWAKHKKLCNFCWRGKKLKTPRKNFHRIIAVFVCVHWAGRCSAVYVPSAWCSPSFLSLALQQLSSHPAPTRTSSPCILLLIRRTLSWSEPIKLQWEAAPGENAVALSVNYTISAADGWKQPISSSDGVARPVATCGPDGRAHKVQSDSRRPRQAWTRAW